MHYNCNHSDFATRKVICSLYEFYCNCKCLFQIRPRRYFGSVGGTSILVRRKETRRLETHLLVVRAFCPGNKAQAASGNKRISPVSATEQEGSLQARGPDTGNILFKKLMHIKVLYPCRVDPAVWPSR